MPKDNISISLRATELQERYPTTRRYRCKKSSLYFPYPMARKSMAG